MDSPISLPLEIVIYIFKFLSLSDRKQARLVCQQWYYASQDSQFLQQELVHIQHSHHVTDLLNSNRNFSHLLLKGSDINWKNKEFWSLLGPTLRSLSLLYCDICDRDFIDVLKSCPRLESLRTWGCRDILMSGRLFSDEEDVKFLKSILLKLKELCLEDNSYLSDALFNRFVEVCPCLESLSLNRCQISFHQGLCKKFYPNLGKDDVRASSSILTFQNILNYISEKAAQIRQLSFSNTIIDSQALTQLSQVNNLHLDTLHLSQCEQLTSAGVTALAKNQPHIKHLDLSYSSRVTDAGVIAICQNLSQLQHLDLHNCGTLTDFSISELYKLSNLIYLDISHCSLVGGQGVLKGICNPSHKEKLRKLFLSGINNMTPDVVVQMAQILPLLTHLDLSYCYTAVTDVSIQAIFQYQIWLRSLEVNGCDNISDAGLTGMGMGMRSAQGQSQTQTQAQSQPPVLLAPASPRISLGSRAEKEIVNDAKRKEAILQLCKDDLMTGKPSGFSLARLKGLRVLSLQGCSRISDVSLFYAFRFLELAHLDLTQCHQVTVEGLKSLSENNPSLEALHLNHCLSVTDEAVFILTKNLRRLKDFSLKGCQKLSNDSLTYVSKHCDRLRRLDMRNCKGIKDASSLQSQLEKVTQLLLPVASSDSFPPPLPPPLPPSLLPRR